MAFIRKKRIGGRIYYYLVEGVRVNGRVRQRVLRYLGNSKRLEGLVAKQRPDPVPTRKLTPEQIAALFQQLAFDLGRTPSSREFRIVHEAAWEAIHGGRIPALVTFIGFWRA